MKWAGKRLNWPQIWFVHIVISRLTIGHPYFYHKHYPNVKRRDKKNIKQRKKNSIAQSIRSEWEKKVSGLKNSMRT
jgi:hypothetical protein